MLEQAYDAKTAVLSRTILFVLIPVFAVGFAALPFRKRRYFAEHLVVATHFWSFALLVIGVLVPLLLAFLAAIDPILGVPAGTLTSDAVPTVILQFTFAVYLFLMLRRVYALSSWYAVLAAGAVARAFFFMVWLFRYLLFVTTLASI